MASEQVTAPVLMLMTDHNVSGEITRANTHTHAHTHFCVDIVPCAAASGAAVSLGLIPRLISDEREMLLLQRSLAKMSTVHSGQPQQYNPARLLLPSSTVCTATLQKLLRE